MTDKVFEEVRRAVADCIPGDRILRIWSVAEKIAERFAAERISSDVVARYLLEAGVAAGIPIEMDRPSATAR